ncbi:hypothetical protein [Streptomyces olivochromogenes]|uniref:hypothetical protein n=1 Tax=Streptomyces olivochromogenes TaxID=1963 RepID=UPI001F1F43C6|nr:hypothetical protein [Streptomyces olivochromogenes]MCF3132264.1 hypothetical protein [Streptomyces olivochromogenes]
MADAEALRHREFLTAAACAPDRYCREVADAVTSALFAPQPPLRQAALRAVMLTTWPQLARPLAAHALTEPDDALASFAHSLMERLYHESSSAHLLQPPQEPDPGDHTGDDAQPNEASPQSTPTQPVHNTPLWL